MAAPFPDAHSLLFVRERSCCSASLLRSLYIDELTSIHQQQLRGGFESTNSSQTQGLQGFNLSTGSQTFNRCSRPVSGGET